MVAITSHLLFSIKRGWPFFLQIFLLQTWSNMFKLTNTVQINHYVYMYTMYTIHVIFFLRGYLFCICINRSIWGNVKALLHLLHSRPLPCVSLHVLGRSPAETQL